MSTKDSILMRYLGFASDDLNANRKGQFSADQSNQMNTAARNIVTSVMRYIAIVALILIGVIVALHLAFGQTGFVRLISIVLIVVWLAGSIFASYVVLYVSRLRGRVRVGDVTGKLHTITPEPDRITFQIDDETFMIPTPDAEKIAHLLKDGATYSVYFMTVNNTFKTFLSMEKRQT